MSPAHLLEPTYDAIKQRLMEGVWPPGFRLATSHVATELDVSLSPVRDSLNRLAGERMVDFWPGAGFHVPQIDEQGLCRLLDLNLVLLLGATAGERPVNPLPDRLAADHAIRTAAVFRHIAEHSRNAELVLTVRAVNDRLHVFQRLDPMILPAPAAEIRALETALAASASSRTVRGLLSRYHVLRKRDADRYIQLRTETRAGQP